MEETKPVKGRKKLFHTDKEGVKKLEDKIIAQHKIGKILKNKVPLPPVRSQSVSPTSAASTSGIKEPTNLPKAGNKTDKVAITKGKTAKPIGKGIVKTTKDNGTAKKTKDSGNAKKTKDSGTAKKTKDVGIAKKSKDVGIAKKSKDVGIAKKTKAVGIATKTRDVEIDEETEDMGTEGETEDMGTEGETEDMGTVEETEDMGTDEKTEEDAKKLKAAVKASRVKVSKEKSVVGNKSQKPEITVKKLKLIEDVYEAIITNGQPRKGVTSQAIKNYIFSKRGLEGDETSLKRYNTLVNNALRKGMEDGVLQRPTTSKGNGPIVSAAGRFMLTNKVVKPKVSKKLKPKKDEGSDTME